MKERIGIIYKNIARRPLRSLALMVLAAVLSVAVFAGTVVVRSLQNGFTSLQERLGADIMVVPYEAVTKTNFENMLLQGSQGYFYMNGEFYDKLAERDGVGRITAQYYLASVKSSCCSIPVQIIGFEPETDFVILPWIKKSTGKDVGYLDVVVGNDLNAFVGDTLSFFDVEVNVVGKLDKTGTAYDTEVFVTHETVQTLIQASLDKSLNEYASINAGNIVSCVLIDVAEGYDVEDVKNDINIHFKKLRAIRTKNMIAGISDSLSGVTKVARVLTAVVWVIALAIMLVAFFMMTGERRKEFAVLRVLGASRRKLSGLVLWEGVGLSAAGSAAGALLGALVIVAFSGFIEAKLQLPFLLPGAGRIVLAAVLALALSSLSGAAAAGGAAWRIGKQDTGTILRSGE